MSLYFADHGLSKKDLDEEEQNMNPQQHFMDLLEQLQEEFLNPDKPVSKRALRSLPVLFAKKEHKEHDPCSICQEKYQIDEKLVELPCGHLFHKDCCFQWFEKQNTCVLCRKTLESDNPDVNITKQDKEELKHDVMHSMYM